MATAVPISPPAGHSVRLLVVDDSLVVRAVFQRILERQPDFEVAGACSSVDEALAFLACETVDIVLLDIEMPGRSGLDALPEIMVAAKGAAVIVISAHVEKNAPSTVEALSLGACDTLSKPGTSGSSVAFPDALVEKISAIALQRGGTARNIAVAPAARELTVRPGCIAIGASTGGIVAIQQFLLSLPEAIDCPILITQHLPCNFIPYFATQLAGRINRPVSVGDPGQAMLAGHCYIASGESHLGCQRGSDGVRLSRVSGEYAVRYAPAVDPMLESVALVFGPVAVGIVLSGMGIDGLDGARLIRAEGGTIIVQDEDSSVVWGMPGGIARAGLADAIMRPADMGAYLYERSFAA